ncbi:hypothetical protein [Parashewanella tropica]|uniref:hypothetical protein n=1 Tax=Parashewanella tropica TaxID=2547970 RepID=UPI001059F7E2|nr:hypothetical protein [Parashewanella tropica]
MREYGKIYSRYWRNEDILHTSDADKLLGTYLLTSSHTNLIGCSHLPIGYVTADLGWDEQKVLGAFKEQEQRSFITRCELTNWILINNYLNYNPIQNLNQGTSAYRLLLDVPDSCSCKPKLLNKLRVFQAKLPLDFIDYYNQRITDNPIKIARNKSSEEQKERDHFLQFWLLQIRKEKKNQAQEAWNKLGLHTDSDRALHVIGCWKDQKQHRKQYQDKSKTPLPCNWLANEQWLDEFIRNDEPITLIQASNHSIKNNSQTTLETNNQAIVQKWMEKTIESK